MKKEEEEEEERGKKGWGWEDRRDVGTNLRNEDDRFQLDGVALAAQLLSLVLLPSDQLD